jgi:hypothetical protein
LRDEEKIHNFLLIDAIFLDNSAGCCIITLRNKMNNAERRWQVTGNFKNVAGLLSCGNSSGM